MTTPQSEPDHYLPSPKRNGYWYIFGAFGLLAVIGIVLVALYRDAPLKGDAIERKRQKNAQQVAYTIVLSKIDPALQNRAVAAILASIGKDTLTTDMVIGSPVVDPWCANVGEFERNLRKAMNQTKELPIGKQTQIVSMVAGLLTKNSLPSTIYLIGSLHDTSLAKVRDRTSHSASGIKLRQEVIGPVSIVNMLTPSASAIHTQYIQTFSDAGIPVKNFEF